MALMPAPFVDATQPRGLRYGLLAAATGPLELPQHALASGVRFRPVSCGGAHNYPVDCPTDDPETKQFDPATPIIEADTFAVYATVECSRVGLTATQIEDMVRQRLASGEQTAAEVGMAEVLAAGAVPLSAPADSDIRSVIGELEEWLYGVGGAAYGNVGFLHAPVRFANMIGADGLLYRDGPLWRTHMGTIVVFGGGYPDDGTIYISGQVTVWRAADVTVPPPDQTWDRELNLFQVLAEREYAVAYDCVAASAGFVPEGGVS